MLVYRVCGARWNFCVFHFFCNPDLDDLIYYCLLASLVDILAEDVQASFLFVGDLNYHHQESRTTNCHGVRHLF